MSTSHKIISFWSYLCQKLLNLVETRQSYDKNNFDCFLRHGVYKRHSANSTKKLTMTIHMHSQHSCFNRRVTNRPIEMAGKGEVFHGPRNVWQPAVAQTWSTPECALLRLLTNLVTKYTADDEPPANVAACIRMLQYKFWHDAYFVFEITQPKNSSTLLQLHKNESLASTTAHRLLFDCTLGTLSTAYSGTKLSYCTENTSCEFYYDDVTVMSFMNIKYGDVATEIDRKRALNRFFF